MTHIGILGTGRMGIRLAKMLALVGNKVVLASRTTERARHIAAELNVPSLQGGTYAEALEAPVVIPSIFVRDGLLNDLNDWRESLKGKILVDITNPFNDDYTDFILPWDTSSAEQIQTLLPETSVVGAFKNVWWEVFDQPDFAGRRSDVFVVSDTQAAKAVFFKIVEGTPFRYVDAGRLANARTIERMTLLSGEIGHRMGFFPRMNYSLLGESWAVGKGNAGIDALVAR